MNPSFAERTLSSPSCATRHGSNKPLVGLVNGSMARGSADIQRAESCNDGIKKTGD